MKRFLTTLCFILLMTGCGGGSQEETLKPLKNAETESGIPNSEKSGTIVVDVVGEVNRPGVHTLSKDARVHEAVEAAGGFTERAAVTGLNMARKLKDGEQVRVPNAEEQAEAQAQDHRINLNTASEEELQKVRGIGPSKAKDIVLYREENGPFSSIEEIQKIRGIKEAFFEKVKEEIKVE